MATNTVGTAVDLPAVIMVPLLIATALISGGGWAAIAGLLKRYFRMDEFIVTLMLNFVAEYFTLYLASGPLRDPLSASPQTLSINVAGRWALSGLRR